MTDSGKNTSTLFKLTPIAASVVAALQPTGPVHAQDGESSGIDEITVTATKREMSMQDLAQSIIALTGDDIARQGFQDMEDFMRALPSVQLNNSIPGRNSIVMRGISTGTQDFYVDAQVAVYLDEQPITTISQQVDVYPIDIERIEALPGPQGTLFGSSSQGGTLRYITNKPDPTGISGEVDFQIGTTKGGDESTYAGGWINLPIVEDKFAIRIVGFTSEDGGYVDNVLGTTLEGSEDNSAVVDTDQNVYENQGGRISARWDINEDWGLDLSYIRQDAESNGTWESDPALGDFMVTRFFDEFRTDEWDQSSLTLTGDMGFATLTATASTFDRTIIYEWDNMVYEQWKDAYWGVYYGYDLYNSDYTYGTIFNDQIGKRDAYELRLTSSGDSRFRWMIGGFYEDSLTNWFYGADNPDYVGTTSWYAAQYYAYWDVYYGYDTQYPLPETTIGYSETYNNEITQKAVFGEMEFDFTEKFTGTLGARWFEYDRDTLLIYQFPQGLPPVGSEDTQGAVPARGVEEDTVIKVSAKYHFNDSVMMYGLYSQGFRLGGFNSQRAANFPGSGIPLRYKPDTLDNFELGLKSVFADGNFLLNVTAFSMQWDDIQINQSNVGNQWWLRGTINGGKAENNGVEVHSIWHATDRFMIEATAYFGDAKTKDEVQRVNDVVPAGSPLVWSPDHSLKIALEYTFPDVFGGNLWLRYDHYSEAEKWNNLSNVINNNRDGLLPSYTLGNAAVGWYSDSGLSLHLQVSNVWDDRVLNSLYQDTSGEFFGDARFNNIRSYNRPRTVSLRLTKRFE